MNNYREFIISFSARQLRFFLSVITGLLLLSMTLTATAYEREGWAADIEGVVYNVEAIVTIVDAQTIQIDNFTYEGNAPAVYFYLGANDTQNDFVNGMQIGSIIDRTYNNESLTLTLPTGTLDGYNAISLWCVAFAANFGSATFVEPISATVPTLAEWAIVVLSAFLLIVGISISRKRFLHKV